MKVPEVTSRFHIGDRVWIVSLDRVMSDTVRSVLLEVFSLPDTGLVVRVNGYTLSTLNLESTDHSFQVWELYTSKEKALQDAKWTHVQGISDANWLRAVGNRDIERSITDSQLSPCCAEISNARDLLLKCKLQGGLNARDVRTLNNLIVNHGFSKRVGGPLETIFVQLGIKNAKKAPKQP